MNAVLWFLSGLLAAGINLFTQKWSVDRMEPASLKESRLLLFAGLALRMGIVSVVLIIALRAGVFQTACAAGGILLGKWIMLSWWLNRDADKKGLCKG